MDRTLHVCMSGPRHANKASMLACIKECTTKCIATFEGSSFSKQPSKGHTVSMIHRRARVVARSAHRTLTSGKLHRTPLAPNFVTARHALILYRSLATSYAEHRVRHLWSFWQHVGTTRQRSLGTNGSQLRRYVPIESSLSSARSALSDSPVCLEQELGCLYAVSTHKKWPKSGNPNSEIPLGGRRLAPDRCSDQTEYLPESCCRRDTATTP